MQYAYQKLSTPLIKAAQQASRDVISLLIQHGADTELGDERSQTPLFYAANIASTQELLKHGASVNHQSSCDQTPLFRATNVAQMNELLRHGANVNHQDKSGETALFDAIWKSRRDMVECLISNGADVNIVTKSAGEQCGLWAVFKEYSFTPLKQALTALIKMSNLTPSTFKSGRDPVELIESYFDIIKRIVPLSDNFSFTAATGETEPCVVRFFKVESQHGWDDLIVTKYLLRHGARAKFSLFYDCIFKCNFNIKPFSKAFLKLALLSGCSFDGWQSELQSDPCRRPVHSANASLVQSVQALVTDLFSQPLTLQELSIMAVRQCIGSRQLWTKIDALPVPRSVKDMIQLKTFSPDKNGHLYVYSWNDREFLMSQNTTPMTCV